MQQTMQWHKYRTLDPGLVWLRGLLQEAVLCMDAELGAAAAAAAAPADLVGVKVSP
jgi:hypothetical protein